MNDLQNLSRWFKAQLGTVEQPKGSNNIVYNTQYYGREVSGDAYPWCVSFEWCGFNACNLSHLFLGGEKTASVAYIMDWAQRHGQWVTSGYREGDILCYGTAHTGYCISCNGPTCTAIEGNYGDRVAKVVRSIAEITGAFRPRYAERNDIPTEDKGPDWGYIPATDPEEDPGWGDIPATDPETQDVQQELPPLPEYDFQPGDIVRINPGASWYNGKSIPGWVKDKNWIIHSVYKERAVLNRSESGGYRIMSAISIRYLSLIKTADEAAAEAASATEYMVCPGDTLWDISRKFLGKGGKYKLIMEANNLSGTDIFPGQILKIPGKD